MSNRWPFRTESPTAVRRTRTWGLSLVGLLLLAGLLLVTALLKPSPIDREAAQPVVQTEGLAAAFLKSAAIGGETSRAVVQLGHRHEITDFTFLGDGRDLLTTPTRGGREVILWDAVTGKQAHGVVDPDQIWTDYFLSPDG